MASWLAIWSKADPGEVGEHDLRYRPHAHYRRADRGADDCLFRDRRVPHPLRAETLEEPDSRLEYPSRRTDVLAEEDHFGIGLELVGYRLGYCLSASELGHQI